MNIPGLPPAGPPPNAWVVPPKQNDILVLSGDAAASINENFDRLFKAAGKQALALAAYQVNLATDVTGIVPPANLGSGAPSSSTFLRGDGVWAAPASGSGGDVNARHRAWSQEDAGAGRDVGHVSTSTNGTGGIVDTNGVWRRLRTAAGVGSTATYVLNSNMCWFDHNPSLVVRFKTGPDVTNIRLWFWLGTASPTNNNDTGATTTAHAAAVRYSTSAPDAGFVGFIIDSGAVSTTASIATIAANTVYTVKVTISGKGTLATFSVTPDGGTEATAQLALAAATGFVMFWAVYIYALIAAAKDLLVTSIYTEFDSHN